MCADAAAWGFSFAIAAATASLACRAASSIAAWDATGLTGFDAAPFVAASANGAAAGTAGGVNDFWLTVNGTAGVKRFVFGAGTAGFVDAAAGIALGAVGSAAGTVVGISLAGAEGDTSGALLLPGSSDVRLDPEGGAGAPGSGACC